MLVHQRVSDIYIYIYIYIYDSSLMIFHLVCWFSRNLDMEEVPRRIGWRLWVTVVDWCRCGNSRCQGSKMVGFARKNVGFSLEKWWVWPGTMLISPWNMWIPLIKNDEFASKKLQSEKDNHLPIFFFFEFYGCVQGTPPMWGWVNSSLCTRKGNICDGSSSRAVLKFDPCTCAFGIILIGLIIPSP